MRTRICLAAALLILATGCANDPPPPTPAKTVNTPAGVEVFKVHVGDRDVWCVSTGVGNSSTLSCDFTREAK